MHSTMPEHRIVSRPVPVARSLYGSAWKRVVEMPIFSGESLVPRDTSAAPLGEGAPWVFSRLLSDPQSAGDLEVL
jgi:hypothetical protein